MNTVSINKLLVVFVTSLLLATSVAAQQNRGDRGDQGNHYGPPDAETRVARMTGLLDLSDEQSAQMLEIMQEVDAERAALHNQAFRQIEPEVCALQLSVEAQLRNILTADQMAILDERKSERGQARSHNKHNGMGPLDCSAYE